MTAALIIMFVVAYAFIALEEPLGINKSAAALVGAGVLWTVYATASGDPHLIDSQLSTSLVSTAQIAFFLIGAMTIVEVIDSHDGFEMVTSRLRARSLPSLAWLIAGASFFLSAVPGLRATLPFTTMPPMRNRLEAGALPVATCVGS